MPEIILGVSAYYHDSAAAILMGGDIIAAAQEERFTRKKHDSSFPTNAVKYVLLEAGADLSDVVVSFYDKPFLKFERLLETYHAFAPIGLTSFLSAIPVWIKEKLFIKKIIKNELAELGNGATPKQILFPEHHLSHAASAFYPSPFDEAAIVTCDGVGEWATTSIGYGKGKDITILRQLDFPHSLGLLYSTFTYYCGFKVNSGEYKLMGLAPYGQMGSKRVETFDRIIRDELVDIREDGSFLLNMENFNFATGLTMCIDEKWEKLFGIQKREPESKLTQAYSDLALAIQNVTEEIMLKMAKTARKLTSSKYLVMAGGVALNCVANGKLLKEGLFKDIWIQPAAGDAGGALGAAYAAWHIWKGEDRKTLKRKDAMKGAFLGPKFNEDDVERLQKKYHAVCKKYSNINMLCNQVATLMDRGDVVGWFQGRMEYGPRALGNRSILGDPRDPDMQKKLNLKIKFREGFRPFAPSVLEDDMLEYFELGNPSPYMLMVAPVLQKRRKPLPENYKKLGIYEQLYHQRSDIPAVTHVDYSARIQSVSQETNERYWKLINAFKEKTGIGLLVNTSFNVRGEPLVCTLEDAYQCFMRTEMDWLVIGDFLFDKKEQPKWEEKEDWKRKYVLD